MKNYLIWQANEAKWNPEKSRKIFLKSGIKNIGKSRPEKSRDPGIWQNPVPKDPGIEILDPARAWSSGPTLVLVCFSKPPKIGVGFVYRYIDALFCANPKLFIYNFHTLESFPAASNTWHTDDRGRIAYSRSGKELLTKQSFPTGTASL